MALRKAELMYSLFGKTTNEKCKDCMHLKGGANEYKKCEVYGKTSSEATDWAMRYDACGLFNKDFHNDYPIVHLVQPERRKEVQIDGQMSLDLGGLND